MEIELLKKGLLGGIYFGTLSKVDYVLLWDLFRN